MVTSGSDGNICSYMKRCSPVQFESAMTLMEIGRSDSEISRLTGISRATVRAWRHGVGIAHHLRLATARPTWRPVDPQAYCYLLGIYLGDGCISVSSRRSASLIITLDSRYPDLVAEVEAVTAAVLPGVPVNRYPRMGGSVSVVQANHPALPFVFPQHGPGKKHTREIKLTDWQLELTRRHPRELLRGLIHSDGCRAMNRFRTKLPSGRVAEYEYPRYFFSNLSLGIRQIFCEHCDLLGIRWTQSNSRNISVSHRHSVALLDQFIGPKS
jgi:hypothetical protein